MSDLLRMTGMYSGMDIPVSKSKEYESYQFKERTEEAGVEADCMAGLKLQDLQYVQ